MANPFNKVFYATLTPDLLTVRNAQNGKQIAEVPEVAFETQPKMKILGVGAEARRLASHPGVKLVNPFDHPRMLLSDFDLAEVVLKKFIARLVGGGLFATAPTLVMHVPDGPEGGYTPLEIRAFRELGVGASPRKATVWQGRALTDAELLSGKFPEGGRVLTEGKHSSIATSKW